MEASAIDRPVAGTTPKSTGVEQTKRPEAKRRRRTSLEGLTKLARQARAALERDQA